MQPPLPKLKSTSKCTTRDGIDAIQQAVQRISYDIATPLREDLDLDIDAAKAESHRPAHRKVLGGRDDSLRAWLAHR